MDASFPSGLDSELPLRVLLLSSRLPRDEQGQGDSGRGNINAQAVASTRSTRRGAASKRGAGQIRAHTSEWFRVSRRWL
jgi:hypothetical protein